MIRRTVRRFGRSRKRLGVVCTLHSRHPIWRLSRLLSFLLPLLPPWVSPLLPPQPPPPPLQPLPPISPHLRLNKQPPDSRAKALPTLSTPSSPPPPQHQQLPP